LCATSARQIFWFHYPMHGPIRSREAVKKMMTEFRAASPDLNFLIDIENAVIVDVEATPARTYDEVAATQTVNRLPKVPPDRRPILTPLASGIAECLFWIAAWARNSRERARPQVAL
jgi:hypothetical protein